MPERPLPPLQGLVLTGGASSRMGRDKAGLVYGDAPQWRAVADLMQACGVEPFWSCTAAQATEWGLTDRAIMDRVPGHGPASGLQAAFSRNEQVAWLVVGCDYPFLETPDLQRLVDARTVVHDAVVYTNDAAQQIAPLISLWEPSAQWAFLQAFAEGEYSANRVLRRCALRLLTPRIPQVLVDRNSPLL